MKYLNKLFALGDRQSHQQSSTATLTSSLYSVTFVPESITSLSSNNREDRALQEKKGEQLLPSSSSAKIAFERKQISLIEQASGDPVIVESTSYIGGVRHRQQTAGRNRRERELVTEEIEAVKENSGVIDYLLAATIGKPILKQNYSPGKTKASSEQTTFHRQSHNTEQSKSRSYREAIIADDWILVEKDLTIDQHHHTTHNKNLSTTTTTNTAPNTTIKYSQRRKPLTQLKQMALEKTDIELIKSSWIPVRKDPPASGVLLFKGLFIKFPQYLKFFPKFSDLELDRMHEDKQLLRHAIGVIEAVTFVVDAIGDDSKTSQLNDKLVKLVRSHLKRKIGLAEFRNLGIVLIDFICDVVGRGGAPSIGQRSSDEQNQLNKSSTSESINFNSSSIDSETMTSALDKLRASTSPSSSSEEESYLSLNSGLAQQAAASGATNNLNDSSISSSSSSNFAKLEENNDGANKQQEAISSSSGGSSHSNSTKTSSSSNTNNKEAKIDTNLHLVAAWTKLYNVILDLVKREEAAAGE